MLWLGKQRGELIDWLTQRWVQYTGRCVARDEVPWLLGPTGATDVIGDDFFAQWATQHGLHEVTATHDAGLLPEGVGVLDGPRFTAPAVHPMVEAFYAHTSQFEVSVHGRWRGLFRGVGWLIARLFSRRLAQLNLTLVDESHRAGLERIS